MKTRKASKASFRDMHTIQVLCGQFMIKAPSQQPDRQLQQSVHGGLTQQKNQVKAGLYGPAPLSHEALVMLQVLPRTGLREE